MIPQLGHILLLVLPLVGSLAAARPVPYSTAGFSGPTYNAAQMQAVEAERARGVPEVRGISAAVLVARVPSVLTRCRRPSRRRIR
jgi:hypothetical protein